MGFIFMPQEKKFFGLFETLAKKVVEAAELFYSLGRDYSGLAKTAKRLKEVEDEADSLVHQLGNLANASFITPFDREDIRALAHNIDNVVDGVEAAAYRLSIAEMTTLPPVISEFSQIINQIAEEINGAVVCLRNIKKGGKTLSDRCVKINELENKADELHRSTLRKIASARPESATELLYLLNLKEVVAQLEEAADEGEDVANILEAMLTKYT